MYRFRVLLLALLAMAVVMGLRCGSDSPTGTGGDTPGEFTVELEDYTDHYDDEAGDLFVRSEGCSKASGGGVIKGLDYPGEWVEVPVTVDDAGTYEVTLRYATFVGDTLRAAVVVGDCSSSLAKTEAEFVMDKGAGLG
jgi:hypothetical protein